MPEELKTLLEQMNAKYEQLKNGVSADQFKTETEALKNAIDAIKNSSDAELNKLRDILKQHGAMLDGLGEKRQKEPSKDEKSQINDFIDENIDEIRKNIKSQSGIIEFETKVVGTVTTANGTLVTNPMALGPLTDVNLRSADLVKYASISETGRANFSYTETLPKDGDAATVAEGETKPQVDFTWREEYLRPTKVAAWTKLTEEAADDVIGIRSTANNYLRKKHDIAVEKDIYFGDGIAPNSEGATVIARTFNAGAMALGVVNPSLIDVINAITIDIATTHNFVDEEPYLPNVAFVNPVDYFLHFSAAKDNNGLPMYPNASLFGIMQVGVLQIVPTERIPAGKVFVADMTKYHVVKYKPFTIRIGMINDDFVKNLFVILGESRYFAYVKGLDEIAFVYDDIATVQTAITKV